MLTISGLEDVEALIAELEAAEKAIQTGNAKAVMQPALYMDELRLSASYVLSSIAIDDAERAAIPHLVESITGFSALGMMTFEMGGSAMAGASAQDPADPQKIKDLIAQWVSEKKIKGGRDFYKGGRGRQAGEAISNEKIAARIAAIINKKLPGHEEFLNSKNPDGLMAYINSKLGSQENQSSALTSLNDSRLSELLTAVLDAWEALMGARVVEISLQQITQALGPNT